MNLEDETNLRRRHVTQQQAHACLLLPASPSPNTFISRGRPNHGRRATAPTASIGGVLQNKSILADDMQSHLLRST